MIGGLATGLVIPGLNLHTTTQTVTYTSITVITFQSNVLSIVPTTTTQTTIQEQTQTSTATSIETQTQTQLETTTQTATSTLTTTSLQGAVTQTQTETATSTITEFQAAQGSSSIYSNYNFVFPNSDATALVTTIDESYAGVIQATFQSTGSMHLVLVSGSLTESSPSGATSGSVAFPIQPGVGYALSVVNDHCLIICGNGFNVTLSLSYQY